MNIEQEATCTVPSTLDGWACLHEMYTVDWPAWQQLEDDHRDDILSQAKSFFEKISKPRQGHSGFFSMLGHKADFMLLHFRKTFDDLNAIEWDFRKTELFAYLIPETSYVSVVELGMYAMTQKIFDELLDKKLVKDSEQWNKAWDQRIQDQFNRMKGRIFCEIPSNPYVCFYPMNKKRGETVNWYTAPMKERAAMMMEHGMIGRKYGGRIQQIISGSIGFDDWEWGVDLFADDPKVFKELIYEMRFDEASALYAEFGPFYVGMQVSPAHLIESLNNK